MVSYAFKVGIVGLGLFALAACDDPVDVPPLDSEQYGFRGTGMEQITNPRAAEILAKMNEVPPPLYPPEPDDGSRAGDIYENVQVLGDLSDGQFNRLMAHITEWVAPAEEGCGYCHNLNNLAEDSKYTKIVARKMIQMTWAVNAEWGDHVGGVGVTCYTCHRGNAVPANYWVTQSDDDSRALGYNAGQNHPTEAINYASLPADPFTPYLLGDENIRVISESALPTGKGQDVKTTEYTYALMIHMSQSLGENCTFCHNSRAFANWAQSPPQRGTAWYGIRMARQLNNEYMVPLTDVFPDYRKGPEGDVFKVNCGTCHNGVNKPLYGVPMVKDHPELWGGADFSNAPVRSAESETEGGSPGGQ